MFDTISVYYFSMCTLDTRIVVATNSTCVLQCVVVGWPQTLHVYWLNSSSDSQKARTATILKHGKVGSHS